MKQGLVLMVGLLVCIFLMIGLRLLLPSRLSPPSEDVLERARAKKAQADSATTDTDIDVHQETGFYEYPERTYKGKEIAKYEDAHKDACADLCNDNTDCAGFTWHPGNNNSCVLQEESTSAAPLQIAGDANWKVYLKESVKGFAPVVITTANDDKPEVDEETGFYEYSGISKGKEIAKYEDAHKDACADLCNDNTDCAGFTWHPGNNNSCLLQKTGEIETSSDANWKVYLKESL